MGIFQIQRYQSTRGIFGLAFIKRFRQQLALIWFRCIEIRFTGTKTNNFFTFGLFKARRVRLMAKRASGFDAYWRAVESLWIDKSVLREKIKWLENLKLYDKHGHC